MSAAEPEQASVDKQRFFRDVLRTLPRRVWIISLGSLILQIGTFLPVFIVFYLSQQGYSGFAAGLVLGVAGLGRVLGSVVGGHLTDTIGRRLAILLSVIATAGLTALVPFLKPLTIIIIVVGLIGVVSQIHRPAMTAILIDAVPSAQQRFAAFGVLRFAQNIGAALGGVLGGVVASVSYVGLFLAEALALVLFGLIVVVLLRDVPQEPSEADDEEKQPEPKVGYRQALADRTLLRFLVMTVSAMFLYIQSTVSLPLHVNDVGLSPSDFGILMGINGVLVVLLELPIISVVSKFRPEIVLAVANVLTGVGLALTGFTTTTAMLAVTVLIWTFGEMGFSSVANAHLANLTPPGMVGRYQGLYGAAYTIGTGVGPVVGGAVYALNPWALWILLAALGLLGGLLSLRLRVPAAVTT